MEDPSGPHFADRRIIREIVTEISDRNRQLDRKSNNNHRQADSQIIKQTDSQLSK